METSAPVSPSSPQSLAIVPAAGSAYAKMKKMISSPRGKRKASASGSTTPRVFGVSLDDLVQRDCHESGVPAVVHKMCQYLLQNGLGSEGVFRVNGNMKTVDKLKTAFEKNGDADLEEAGDVFAVASLLKMFLRELPDSVIPYDMQRHFIGAHSLREDKEQHLMVLRCLIQKLPTANFDLLKYLINFLNQITDSSGTNKMTPVALAVVFGPNIFRCSDTLQGLQEQACVNAITCKIIEQYVFLFSSDSETSLNISISGDKSPRKKPCRPPPPKFPQGGYSPRKICEDENSNMVDEGLPRATRRMTDSQVEYINQTTKGENDDSSRSSGRMSMQKSVTISVTEPEMTKPVPSRSQSPPKLQRFGSLPAGTSPSRKQILEFTIRDAVKEHLFGANIVMSSSESDSQATESMQSPEDKPTSEVSQTPIRDMLKRFTAEKLSESADKRSKMTRHSAAEVLESKMNNSVRIQSSRTSAKASEQQNISEIDQQSFDFLEDQWKGTLTSLTSNRAPPPRNRKHARPVRKTQSADIENMMRDREKDSLDSMIKVSSENCEDQNDLNNTSDTSRNNYKTGHAENPLLVRIKNDRVTKSLDETYFNRDENGGDDIGSPKHVVSSPKHGTSSPKHRPVSPRTTPLSSPKHATLSPKLRRKMKEIGERKERPVVPPLDLFRVQQEDLDDQDLRISPKERFAHVLADSPIRSPRSFANDDLEDNHKQQIFLEKRQDTVPILDMSQKDLKKRIESLKKIISNFEASFEAQHQRPPKPSEKSQVQKYIAELGRAKKQLRELVNTIKENPNCSEASQTGPEIGFAPNMREMKVRSSEPTKEDTLNALLKKLHEKRFSAGRPEELEVMSANQLKEEKLAVQKALLQYENLHGRPTSKEDKTLMRPIYERYRRIKRQIATNKDGQSISGNTSEETLDTQRSQGLADKSSNDLHPINEGDTINGSRNDGTSKVASSYSNGDELNDTFNITRKPTEPPEKSSSGFSIISSDTLRSVSSVTMNEAVLHDATLEELLKQQKLAKKSKKSLGKKLKDYEDDFFADTGRKVQKEDRGPLEGDYSEYKLIKARLRLLEALITKKKANMTI